MNLQPDTDADRRGSNPGYKTGRDCPLPRNFTKRTVPAMRTDRSRKVERIRMVMEYIHFVMPRIADKETVNHICAEVNKWMCASQLQAQADNRTANQEITNIPLRHFVWNISERFMYKILQRGQPCQFYQNPFPREFADTDIATIKNFKVDPSKTLIPIDEPKTAVWTSIIPKIMHGK